MTSHQPIKGPTPTGDDPVRVLLQLAAHAERAGNGAAARVLAATAELLSAALPSPRGAAGPRSPLQA